MRKELTIALAIVLVTVTACKSSESATSQLPRPTKEFCVAAARYDEKVQVGDLSLDEHVEFVTAIADNAPKDIADQAAVFLDAIKRRANGDKSVVDQPAIQRAVEDVNRRAGQDCGWYERKGL